MFVDYRDVQIIRKLIPLATLSESCFEKLCTECHIEEAPRGTVLFREGDQKNEFVYLLSGKIVLQAGDAEMDTIEGGSETARFALAHQIPRKVSAVAKNKVRFIRVDATLLHIPEEKDMQPTTYKVTDIPQESASDWMSALLRRSFFQRLPAANLQKLLIELQEVRFKSGDTVIAQGEPVEHYYIIKKGRCALSRKATEQAKAIVLAKLRTCDTFGEDALISGEASQVTATMLTDGTLMKLDKSNFQNLIKEPVVHSVDLKTMREDLLQTSTLIDVRPPEDFERKHFKGSSNVPFFSLPMQLVKLDRNALHIVLCEDGKTSEVAAFLLSKNGYKAVVLKGGLKKTSDELLFLAPHNETHAVTQEPPRSQQREGALLDRDSHDGAPPQKSASVHPIGAASAVEALKREVGPSKSQLNKDRGPIAGSIDTLEDDVQSLAEQCESQKARLAKQEHIINELQTTIHSLRQTNARLEDHIRALEGNTSEGDKGETQLGSLPVQNKIVRR